MLAEALRQADGPDVVQKITQQTLALDASVWSPDSASLQPSEPLRDRHRAHRVEAMILHSDNTGTDMSMKLVGVDKVRAFIASAGLTNTLIPESTRRSSATSWARPTT